MADIAFTTRLTESDWDETLRGWRCPPLSVPGAIIEAVYVDGDRIDSAEYEVLQQHAVIRWTPQEQPSRAVAAIKLTEALTTASETDRWKKLAIVLPVIATIASATIAAVATYLTHDDKSPAHSTVESSKPATAANTQSSPSAKAEATPNPQKNTSMRTAAEIAVGGAAVSGDTSDGGRWFKFTVATADAIGIRITVKNVYRNGLGKFELYNGNSSQVIDNSFGADGREFHFRSPGQDTYYTELPS